MERAKRAKEVLNKEVRPALWYAIESNPKIASEMISRMFSEIFDLMAETDERLSKRMEELSSKLAETDERLSKRMEELSKEVDRTSKTVSTLASTVGRLDRRYSKLEEIELRETLERLCFNRGFEVDRGFIAKGRPFVDALVTGKGIMALVEISIRGSSKDLRQLLEASRAYEELNGVKPDALFLLCVEQPDDLTVKRAKEKGVTVTMRPGEIVRKLEAIALDRQQI